MDKENWEQEIKRLISQFQLPIEGYELPQLTKDQEKRLKKKFKKYTIEDKDAIQAAIQKTKKMVDQLGKSYQSISKQNAKVQQMQSTSDTNKAEKDKAYSQLKMAETLHKGFEKKYKDILDNAKAIEKQEQDKRKNLIDELQERIKVVQDEYQSAGKIKIEKFRENQTLKHEISKLEPQTLTTESLYDAQLKKKQIEVEIQMTTLKQKIEMMNNFKNVSSQTKEKIEKAEQQKQKIDSSLTILNEKQEEHKILLTKAHLVLNDYKKSIVKINQLLGKRQREALDGKEKVKKAEAGLVDIENKIKNLDKEEETQRNQIQMLLNLEENLKKELA